MVESADFGKPPPAVVVRSDRSEEIGTVTELPVSRGLGDAPLIRLVVQPTPANGLRAASRGLVVKAMPVKRERLGAPLGCLDDETMLSVTRSLAVFLGIT